MAFDGGSTVSLVTEQQRWRQDGRHPVLATRRGRGRGVEAAAEAKETDARVGGIAVWHNKDKTRQEF